MLTWKRNGKKHDYFTNKIRESNGKVKRDWKTLNEALGRNSNKPKIKGKKRNLLSSRNRNRPQQSLHSNSEKGISRKFD